MSVSLFDLSIILCHSQSQNTVNISTVLYANLQLIYCRLFFSFFFLPTLFKSLKISCEYSIHTVNEQANMIRQPICQHLQCVVLLFFFVAFAHLNCAHLFCVIDCALFSVGSVACVVVVVDVFVSSLFFCLFYLGSLICVFVYRCTPHLHNLDYLQNRLCDIFFASKTFSTCI